MKKYRCPNCKEIFIGTQEVCPKCGVKLHYANKEQEKQKPVEEAVSVSNFIFNDPDVIKHEEKFVPVTSIENMDDKDKDNQDAIAGYQLNAAMQQQQMAFPKGESFFDGKTFARIGTYLLAGLLILITLGFGFPWAYCKCVRWDTSHTVVQGHRLRFTGKGGKLFGKYLLWILLTPLTIGLIWLWVQIFIQRWKVQHIEYVD